MNTRNTVTCLSLTLVGIALSGCGRADAAGDPTKAQTQLPADPPAVAIARAHIEAWSHHHWEVARKSLAPDVHVTVTSTQGLPPTDTMGADKYMEGLEKFAGAVESGSARIASTSGDDRDALIMVTAKANFGQGMVTVVAARMYLLDKNRKIKKEQVVFFMMPDGLSEPAMSASTNAMRKPR
jgi:hypothetical protein